MCVCICTSTLFFFFSKTGCAPESYQNMIRTAAIMPSFSHRHNSPGFYLF